MSEIMVRPEHVRQANLCARGMRVWFKKNNIDLGEFLTKGVTVERLEACNDALANRVCKIARAAAGEQA